MKYEPLDELLTESPYTPPWLIEDMLAERSFTVLAGEAGVGKSTFCYALALHLALGRPFLGHRTSPAHVLYCDDENSRPDYSGYWRQLWNGLGRPDPADLSARIRFASFQLGPGWLETLRPAVAALPEPGLLVLDTATPALHIQDEDKNAEATLAIQGLRSLQAGRRLTILTLKHARIVEGESGPDRYILRGAKAWLGSTDATWFLTFAPGRPPAEAHQRGRLLTPRKTRAFGLRKTIKISATYETAGGDSSLIIKGS